jgi:hypothetical protein
MIVEVRMSKDSSVDVEARFCARMFLHLPLSAFVLGGIRATLQLGTDQRSQEPGGRTKSG